MRRLYIAIPLIFFFQLSRAQAIDTLVSHAVDKFKSSGASMGLSVGVVNNGNIYFYHFGSIKKGLEIPPNNQTIYEIGSVTKTFTSLLLAQAVLDHRAKLTSDVREFLKGNYSNLQNKGVPIGLVQLANLTSGLPNNLPEKIPVLESTDENGQLFELRRIHDAYTKHQFLTDLHTVVLTKSPGLAIAHSNTAAQLLGFTLENLYNSSYQKLLAKFITIPFQMNNTYVEVPNEKSSHYAHGYNEKGISMPDIPQDAAGAGILKSSLPDMITYLKLQLIERDNRIKLVHKPTWGEPGDLAVGLNWMVKTNFDGQRKIWASGGTFGQSSYLCFYPERKFGIVILSNESDGGAEDRLSDLAQTVYNELYFTNDQRLAEGFGFSLAINQLLASLHKNGFDHAISAMADFKKKTPGYKLYENELNLLGYYYYFKGQKEKALEIFKLNVSLYPLSANTYDSLGDTFEQLGDNLNAIKNYERELKLSPGNKDLEDHLKKLKAH